MIKMFRLSHSTIFHLPRKTSYSHKDWENNRLPLKLSCCQIFSLWETILGLLFEWWQSYFNTASAASAHSLFWTRMWWYVMWYTVTRYFTSDLLAEHWFTEECVVFQSESNALTVSVGLPWTFPDLSRLQTLRFQQYYKLIESHAVQQGSHKLGYDTKFNVCKLYDDHTYWIVGYDTSQYTRKCHQCAPSICGE